MLDNDFRNPDLDRYVDCVFEHEPRVGIIGDAYNPAEAQSYVRTIRELEGSFPDSEFIVVPKCRETIEAVPDDIALGYSRGYANTLAHGFSDPVDWRGRRVHILGGSPPKQADVIDRLTQPTLTGDPPADIAGLDWNGLHRGAQFGEFWTADGWDESGREADHVSICDMMRHGLGHVRSFWQANGVGPETTPEADGLAVTTWAHHRATWRARRVLDVERTSVQTSVVPTSRSTIRTRSGATAVNDYYFTHRQRNRLEEIAGKRSIHLPPT